MATQERGETCSHKIMAKNSQILTVMVSKIMLNTKVTNRCKKAHAISVPRMEKLCTLS